MKKLFKYIMIISSLVFPVCNCIQAQRKINEVIRKLQNGEIEYSYMNNYVKLKEENIKEFFDKTFESRKTLEEKAKTNVIGVTITVSIITGLSKLLYDINNSQTNNMLKISIFLLALIALINMVISGFLALAVLGKLNIMNELFPEDLELEDKIRCKSLALYTEINVKYNIIRSNYIYSSYKSIIVSLACLSVIFLFITLPIKSEVQKALEKNQQKQSESISTISEKQEKIIDKINNIEIQIEKNQFQQNINTEFNQIEEEQKEILKILKESKLGIQ